MKIILAIFAFSILAACGGGGSGAAPSVNSADSAIIADQREEVQNDADALRSAAMALGNGAERDSLLQEIENLLAALKADRRTIAELRAEMKKLQEDFNALKVAVSPSQPDPTPNCVGDQTLQNGVCKNPDCIGDQTLRSGVCENPVCVGNQTLQNGVCVDPNCVGDQTLRNGVCENPDCVGDQTLQNGVCVNPDCIRDQTLRKGVCTYDTAEFRRAEHLGVINALYAYENGYHGQDITIAMIDTGSPNEMHEDLRGQVINSLHAGRPLSTSSHSGHATAVGGVIAGLRGGSGYTNIEAFIKLPGLVLGGHGVAPGTKLVSFRGWSRIDKSMAQYFVDNTIRIVNSAVGFFGPRLIGQFRGERIIVTSTPSVFPGFKSQENHAKQLQPAENADIVFAVSAGNDGWQGPQSKLRYMRCNDQSVGGECPYNPKFATTTLTLSDLLSELVDERYGELNTLDISPFGIELQNSWPLINTLLVDNWLAVIALDENNEIANFSNSCSAAKDFCVAAPGVNILSPHRLTTRYDTFHGTSFSAPMVSGALALLKNAADDLTPKMARMTVVRLILLETATPLYADATKNGVRMYDENNDPILSSVYGWGLVNISAGIVHLQSIAMQMDAIGNMGKVRLGGAAKVAAANKFSPAENNAFRFWGGFDSENANKWTGIATREYGGVSGFAEYGNSDIKINSFLANGEIRGVESENWTAGFRYANIFRHNDNLQISARQESPINSGDLILNYSFGKQIRIPLKQKPATIWTVAYSGEINRWIPAFAGMTKGKFGITGGEWTAAAEWNENNGDTGFSFAAKILL